MNTAFGIATGAFAVISYNFYTNKIDNLTYAIDEIRFLDRADLSRLHTNSPIISFKPITLNLK